MTLPVTTTPNSPTDAYLRSRAMLGYVPRHQATAELYQALGFRCGLEVHQQLDTARKLFCRCPARVYQTPDSYDAQLVRHMRPTLSELGEYDGTALMEFRTRKNIIYRIKGETACTYDIDDTPPFAMSRDALRIAIEIALLLGTQIVGEIHITRKQYLDGSIPTGFQRTAIVGIHGSIPIEGKAVRILQLSIEEDSCREVSDSGHERTYMTDRLGMPLVETVTYPDLATPDEAAEAAHYIRFLARSTDKVRVGIGAAREDVNVSIEGGTRVEIKGVQRIRWIPDLTHNEAFRQKALLEIRALLRDRIADPAAWHLSTQGIPVDRLAAHLPAVVSPERAQAINLPGFAGLLCFFTSPGRCFADEISDRVKVVACIDKPNLVSSEHLSTGLPPAIWREIRAELGAEPQDAQLVIWGPAEDMKTAVETIEERCLMAFAGVPNETRKALPDGTTLFERVLPGPDRMYPDTDSAPIPVLDEDVEQVRAVLPDSVSSRMQRLASWRVPSDCWTFILKRNLFPVLERLIADSGMDPVRAGTLLGHVLRRACGDTPGDVGWLPSLAHDLTNRSLHMDLLPELVRHAVEDPTASLDDLLRRVGYQPAEEPEIRSQISHLCTQFKARSRRTGNGAKARWVMGRLRPYALGNLPLAQAARLVEKECVT